MHGMGVCPRRQIAFWIPLCIADAPSPPASFPLLSLLSPIIIGYEAGVASTPAENSPSAPLAASASRAVPAAAWGESVAAARTIAVAREKSSVAGWIGASECGASTAAVTAESILGAFYRGGKTDERAQRRATVPRDHMPRYVFEHACEFIVHLLAEEGEHSAQLLQMSTFTVRLADGFEGAASLEERPRKLFECAVL